ncbi:MAG: carbohydrate kinase [Desulfobulbus sp.]|nr:carbohydrate kinase [Desulfobulbus sp.]
MNKRAELSIFGEVLFDCFPTGEQILGGAPFNVAWHLQALGDHPLFISRIGEDASGSRIVQAMDSWGMENSAVQIDTKHPTGRVEVRIVNNEPSYDIIADSAYDFIDAAKLPDDLVEGGMLYHGTLALRHPSSFQALHELTQRKKLQIFLDVNLRTPWWQREVVLSLLHNAHWAKMNEHELQLLAPTGTDIQQQMAALQAECALEQLIVTRGEQGALVREMSGEMHVFGAEPASQVMDTVGAGDAFSAVFIHGLRAGWPIAQTVRRAQYFAGKVIGLRGAITTDPSFYQAFMDALNTLDW